MMSDKLSKRRCPVHRWYCISEMLPLDIVRKLLKYAKNTILDPFVGVGTVLVEAKLANLTAIGVDINPFMCFVSLVKTRDYNVSDVEAAFSEVLNNCNVEQAKPPSIPNLKMYYDLETLEKLLVLKRSIMKITDRKIRELMMLCFVDVAARSANIKRSPAPRFLKKTDPPDIFSMFKRKVGEVLEDIKNFSMPENKIGVCLGDSCNLNFLNETFDLIVTSPPYCNNVDYVRHTQLELYWLDFVNNSEDLSRIRRGSLTSCEAMAYSGKYDQCALEDIYRIAQEIKKRTKRALPRVMLQYFAGMQLHLESIKHLLSLNSKAFYIIGDSWIKGVYVPTPELLAKIAKKVDFKQVDLQFLRYRKSPRRHKFPLSEYLLTLSL